MSTNLADELQEKIKVLHDSIWERRADWPHVQNWLNQFSGPGSFPTDKEHALFLLTNFMYFGTNEIRALLRSLFRDTFRTSVIADLRHKNPSLKMDEVNNAFEEELKKTRFVSLGNPSESSAFLLYYFRQENRIPRECFISGAEIFDISGQNTKLANPDITRYVFIDDMCGSGDQGTQYARGTVAPLKGLSSNARVYYFALFGMSAGIAKLSSLGIFDIVHPVVALDSSFQCFNTNSRIYRHAPASLSLSDGHSLASRTGRMIEPTMPLGYRDGQLLLGFAYNIPDNTLPIIWSNGSASAPWTPMFKRYSKLSYI